MRRLFELAYKMLTAVVLNASGDLAVQGGQFSWFKINSDILEIWI